MSATRLRPQRDSLGPAGPGLYPSLTNFFPNEGQIGQSFATEAVSSDGTGERLGGLVGYNIAGSTITDTYATGQVGAGAYIGGLVGDNAGAVDTSWADG
jgi:hypothetical protein